VLSPGADGVGDVHERDVDRAVDVVGHLVHRVGAEDEQLGSGAGERPRLGGEKLAGVLPAPCALELLDRREVNGAQQAVG